MALTDNNRQFPRIKLNGILEKKGLVRFINNSSTFSEGDIVGVITALKGALLNHLKEATPVRLEGIGIFSPTLKLDGRVNIRFRADKEFVRELNTRKDSLRGSIKNKKNVGKTLDDLQEITSSTGE